ncbi:MAG TPA: hypothetical protein DCS82_02875, partial [Rhodospirillaceae bacterium]|nr:hypothetical protein [Rhodospirillaceae bacterium]
KKAMILAAGFGKRIQPLTLNIPKPLLKIGKETLLSNSLKFLKLYGINQVVVNVHYSIGFIIDYLNKNKFNLNYLINNICIYAHKGFYIRQFTSEVVPPPRWRSKKAPRPHRRV